jgi:hypothetical protein
LAAATRVGLAGGAQAVEPLTGDRPQPRLKPT